MALQTLQAERVDLNLLDVFVVATQADLDGWTQFFSFDRAGQPRGTVALTLS